MIREAICVLINRTRKRMGNTILPSIMFYSDFPAAIKDDSVYFVGNLKYQSHVFITCPCGCGGSIALPLNAKTLSSWKVQWHIDGSISIVPSIDKIVGCRSHFFYKHGKIIWCSKMEI